MTSESREFLGELRLGRWLTTRRQVVAIGLSIAGALLFLLGGTSPGLSGFQVALPSLIAGLTIGLTLVSVFELLAGSGEGGGTHALIQETMGGWSGFAAGWAILSASMALCAALVLSAAKHLRHYWSLGSLSAEVIGLIILAILVLLHLFRAAPRRLWLWPLVVVVGLGLLAAISGTLPALGSGSLRAAAPLGLRELLQAVAGLSIGYGALEAILASRRQIRNPASLLPSALLTVLVAGSLLFAVMALYSVELGGVEVSTDAALASRLSASNLLPVWFVAALAVVALCIGAGTALAAAARQMQVLSREGALPQWLRKLYRPFAAPPLLFVALALLTGLLVGFVPIGALVNICSSMFLVAMTLLNIAAISSRFREPDRRRTFMAPFHPLLPALAIGLNLALLAALPWYHLVSGVAWLALGSLVYLSYGRRHQADAKEGVFVFGSERRSERETLYSILVPIASGEERHLLLRLAVALARQFDGEVIPLQVIEVPDPLAVEEGRRLAAERNQLFQWSTRVVQDAGVPVCPITRLARSIPEAIINTAVEEECDLILMPWLVGEASPGTRMGRVLDPVVRGAPCDLAIVAFDPAAGEPNRSDRGVEAEFTRLLVPTAGGPHAPLGARLAMALASEYGAAVTAINVTQPDATPEQTAQGQFRIENTIATMREQCEELCPIDGEGPRFEDIPVEVRVVEAHSVVRGIVEAGRTFDLVFVGASDERLIDQVLFGSIPEQIARSCTVPVIMVKRFRGLRRFWLQRIWDAAFGALPTLTRQEQTDVNKQIRNGAQPDIDFFVMMALSSLIATLGLLQGSAAVIIGAMLVAPLFTPILALSLGIVQGHAKLLRMAIEAALKGIALAIGAAILLAAISPLKSLTPEIIARTQPNLFDLAVALASGAAGAYALGRKDVAASLPGVAIAAALVPPLATVGIGLAMADLSVAGGGLLLFATNLIAIVLAGAVTLLLLGFRPAHSEEQETRLRVGLVTSVLLLVLITVPLTAVFVQSVRGSRTRQVIQQTLAQQLEDMPDARLREFDFEVWRDLIEVEATVYATRPLESGEAEELGAELSQALGKQTALRLVSIPIGELEIVSP